MHKHTHTHCDEIGALQANRHHPNRHHPHPNIPSTNKAHRTKAPTPQETKIRQHQGFPVYSPACFTFKTKQRAYSAPPSKCNTSEFPVYSLRMTISISQPMSHSPRQFESGVDHKHRISYPKRELRTHTAPQTVQPSTKGWLSPWPPSLTQHLLSTQQKHDTAKLHTKPSTPVTITQKQNKKDKNSEKLAQK